MKAIGRLLLVALTATLLPACSSLRYYAHVAQGEAGLLARRQPIARIIADPRVDARTRERLREAVAAREFASARLDLPRNRSYTQFVALNRPYVSWSVLATAEFSVDPVTRCFPFAGCVAYRAYFTRALAEREARRLAARGDDATIEGVSAFSTLGWFADPIMSSMLRDDADTLDGTIFHELAHQRFYLPGDSAFNESYASFVEREGVREWRASRGLPAIDKAIDHCAQAVTHLVLDLRERLRSLYAKPLPATVMRAEKAEEFAALRKQYAALRADTCRDDRRYDGWMARPLNNARLLPFGLYDRWVPAFAALFAQVDGNWSRFHERVRELGALPAAARERALAVLAEAPP